MNNSIAKIVVSIAFGLIIGVIVGYATEKERSLDVGEGTLDYLLQEVKFENPEILLRKYPRLLKDTNAVKYLWGYKYLLEKGYTKNEALEAYPELIEIGYIMKSKETIFNSGLAISSGILTTATVSLVLFLPVLFKKR